MYLRTDLPREDIANALHISCATVDRQLRLARAAMETDFVYEHVNVLKNHEDLVKHNTTMCRALFCYNNEDRAVLICDGTYIFTNKSRNYEFQKLTYTDKKKRNFIKIMMIVTTDGTIVYSLGPYSAHDNDAKILRNISETTDALDNLRENDVLMLDRGFRDCVKFFEDKGLVIKMPHLLQQSQNKCQLSTSEANKTRLVTATRFTVETRNGHMKTIWKRFNSEWNPLQVPHLMIDFHIGAALINKYFKTFEPNKGIERKIADRMLARVEMQNVVAKTVKTNAFQKIIKKLNYSLI